MIKLKIITGFRKDQKYTIDGNEAHKAYWLFMNPTERGVFSNGVALTGSMIQGIEPDYNATMGWNDSHVLDNDDWNEINQKGIAGKMSRCLQKGSEVARLIDDRPELVSLPLSTISMPEIPSGINDGIRQLSDQMKN